METSLPLASDSFSYSWLSNSKSSEQDDGLKESQSLRESVYTNFNFDVSITHSSPVVLVPADEIFSDGLLKPMFVEPSKVNLFCNTPDLNQTRLSGSAFSSSSRSAVSPRTVEIQHGFLARWRRLTRRTVVDFFRYVNQLRMRVSRSRKSIRVDDVDETIWHGKSFSCSQKESPRIVRTNPVGDFHDHENSIYEAVLHCKRSIGK